MIHLKCLLNFLLEYTPRTFPRSVCARTNDDALQIAAMSAAPPPPEPVYYLSPGEAVTCLCHRGRTLYAATGLGNILTYSVDTWALQTTIQAFRCPLLESTSRMWM